MLRRSRTLEEGIMASMIDEILAQLPAEDLAARLGTDPNTAMDAARKALPALVGGQAGSALPSDAGTR